MALTPEEMAELQALEAEFGAPEQPSLSQAEQQELQMLEQGFGAQQPMQQMQDPSMLDRAGNAWEGIKRGSTLAFGDEIQAGIAGAVGALSPDLTFKQGYEQALADFRGEYEQAREQTPWTTGAGELAGAIVTGITATPRAVSGALTNVASKGFLPRAVTAAGVGGTSGGVYGYGTGEGGAEQRLKEAAKIGGLGVAGGVVGTGVGVGVGKLGNKVANMLAKKKASKQALAPMAARDIAELQDIIEPVTGGEGAYGKIAKQLKKDLGDNYDNALQAYKDGDISLAELNGSRTRTLAQGAAQYPSGKAAAQEFFDPKAAGSYDRVLKSIKDNVSGVESYHTTASDLLAAGRAKAAPIYKEAYEGVIDIDDEALNLLTTPEIQSAIKRAKSTYATELDGVAEDSVKMLDYAKKEMDDIISAANREGAGNKAGYLTGIKNQMVDLVDSQIPAYKEARKVSGDYLSIDNAMEEGRKVLKTDSELTDIVFSKLNDAEKAAYQVGLGKAIRDEVGKVAEGANPYRRILGSPEKQKRISSVLSPRQFKNLEADLKAEDRLFKMRNEVLGGSPTAGKQEAKNLISGGVGAVDDVMQIPRKTMISGLRKFFDGLDDKTAGKVSEVLYETDPKQKLIILDKMSKSKDFSIDEKALMKKAYFEAAEKFDVNKARAVGAEAGGVLPAITSNEE